jgi:hypothetical protein
MPKMLLILNHRPYVTQRSCGRMVRTERRK